MQVYKPSQSAVDLSNLAKLDENNDFKVEETTQKFYGAQVYGQLRVLGTFRMPAGDPDRLMVLNALGEVSYVPYVPYSPPDLSGYATIAGNQTFTGFNSFTKKVSGVASTSPSNFVIRSEVYPVIQDVGGGAITQDSTTFEEDLALSVSSGQYKYSTVSPIALGRWRVDFAGPFTCAVGFKSLKFSFPHNIASFGTGQLSLTFPLIFKANCDFRYTNYDVYETGGVIYVELEIKVLTSFTNSSNPFYINYFV